MSLTLPRPRQALGVWNTPAVSALDRACAVLGMQPVLEETSLCAEMGGGFHARGRLVEITEWESKFTQWEPRYSVKHGAGQSDPDPAYLDWAGAHLGPEGVPGAGQTGSPGPGGGLPGLGRGSLLRLRSPRWCCSSRSFLSSCNATCFRCLRACRPRFSSSHRRRAASVICSCRASWRSRLLRGS